MRTFIILIPLLVISTILPAATWHVALSGSDDASGSKDSPFRTIQKAADVAETGDVCIIHEGTYRETVTPASHEVVFIAAQGETVVVSAYESVTDWSLHEGSVYVAQLSWNLDDENQVLYNGEMMTLARWPNKTNTNPFDLEANWASGTSSYVAYPNIPDWQWENGGVIYFLGKNRWTSWRRPITDSTSNRVSFGTLPDDWDYGGQHNPAKGGEFFLMNILEALDSNGEWFIDRQGQQLYFQAPDGGNPSTGETLVRKRTTAFDLSTRVGVIIDGITVMGGNIILSDAGECVVRNCRILYGNHTISSNRAANVSEASIVMNDNSFDNMITRNEIQWGAGNGVVLKGSGNRLDNNHIGNFNYLGCYACPVELRGGNDVTRNQIFNGGRDLIRGGGYGSNIGYNDLHHSNLINDDCGAIYTCCNQEYGYTRIHHNWIHDISSRNEHYGSYKAAGVYLDNTSKRVIVDHNVIWNLEWSCIQINWEGEDLLIYNNTLWSNPQPNSKSMAWWENGYVLNNVRLINNLVNNPDLIYTETSNNCILELSADPFEAFGESVFVPKDGTCAIDAGMIIPEYADDYIGGAPDAGAYERGAPLWVPGPDWSIGDRLNNEDYTPELSLVQDSINSRSLVIDNLNPFGRYRVERFSDGSSWEPVLHFEQAHDDSNVYHESPVETSFALYQVRELIAPYTPGTLITFQQFEGLAHDAHVPNGTTLLGAPDDLTITIGGDSDGFGVVQNPIQPATVEIPALYVRGDGAGSSFLFSRDVTVHSLWTSSPPWALNNDPSGTQTVTGKLDGQVVWNFTNSTESTDYVEITAGAGKQIDELVIYPKWIGVDNLRVE